MVAHLAPAELAHRQDGHVARLAGARAVADLRPAELGDELLILGGGDLGEADFGNVGEHAGRSLKVFLAEQIADADAELLVVLEAVQDRLDVLRRPAKLLERFPQALAAGQSVQHETVHQPVDHARIADKDVREVRAVGAKLDVKPQAGRIEAEQFPKHALAAQRLADTIEIHQGRVGIGRGADFLQQRRRDRCQGSAGSGGWKGSGSSLPTTPSGSDRPVLRRGSGYLLEHRFDQLGCGSGSSTRSASASAAWSSPKASCSRWSRILRLNEVFSR